MEAAASLEDTQSEEQGLNNDLDRIAQALGLSIQLLEGWEKKKWGNSNSVVRLSFKRSASSSNYELSQMKIGKPKPTELSTSGLNDISFGQDW